MNQYNFTNYISHNFFKKLFYKIISYLILECIIYFYLKNNIIKKKDEKSINDNVNEYNAKAIRLEDIKSVPNIPDDFDNI